MNIVDSSGWLEYFADGPNARFFATALKDTPTLLVPVICIFEVFKRIAVQTNEANATVAVAQMLKATVVELDACAAISAAKLSARQQLPMADSLIYFTAQSHGATLWTQDADFEGLEGVKYVQKPK